MRALPQVIFDFFKIFRSREPAIRSIPD